MVTRQPIPMATWEVDPPLRTDRDDGDGKGSRFGAHQHRPEGEAPFSAPQAKKTLGPKAVFLDFLSGFEHLGGCSSSLVLSTVDSDHIWYLHQTFQGCYQGLMILSTEGLGHPHSSPHGLVRGASG